MYAFDVRGNTKHEIRVRTYDTDTAGPKILVFHNRTLYPPPEQ